MAGIPKNGLVVAGAIVALVGALMIAVPVFTTEQTKEVAKIGDLKLTTKEETSYTVPPFVGPAVLVIGVILMGAGFVVRR